ncbi:TolC family protein [Aureispira anguillae]|uniref:TolC family protein n=1 Tax=Aureispira anguillae TaxID=2864201 RepID=A0A915YHL0_9BACT|nr:TolC family protein [Aureispira anguillae]BDS13162.1 TolC family protein [Aureispira anguillae]
MNKTINRSLIFYFQRTNIYISISFLLLTSLGLKAQTTISMQEAIERIKTQHPNVLQQDLYIQQQRILKDAGKVQPAMGMGYSFEELGLAGSGVHSIYLQQDFNLPQVAQRKVALQEALAQTGEWQKAATQKQLERSVAGLYQQILFLKSQQNLNTELLDLYTKIEKIAQKRAEVGETGQLPIISTQSAKQQIQLQQMNTQQNYTTQLMLLQQFLMDNNIEGLSDTALVPLSIPASTNEIETHPLVQQIDQQMTANTLQSEVIKSQLLPQISTSFQVQVVDQTFPNFGAQIGLNVPLFSKGIKAQVKANELTTKILAQNKTWQIQQLNSQKAIALNQMTLLQEQLSHFEQVLLPNLQQQQALSQQAYSIGELDYLNVLQGLTQIIAAKQRYLQLILQLNLAWIDYRYLVK